MTPLRQAAYEPSVRYERFTETACGPAVAAAELLPNICLRAFCRVCADDSFPIPAMINECTLSLCARRLASMHNSH